MNQAKFWHEKLQPFTKKSNTIALWQIISTLVPYILLWVAYVHFIKFSPWLVIPFALVTCFFVLRFFVLMHDCGHGAMFESKQANKLAGFFLGVLTGMPSFVWSKNHAYHHRTNGDWVRYGGVFNIITTETYSKLTPRQQKNYWLFRQPLILIPAGFFYVLLNPRLNWILGMLTMVIKIMLPMFRFNFSESLQVANEWKCKYWEDKKDFRHMTYNNLVLFSLWFIMCSTIGVAEFFIFYVITNSLAGSLGILFFTVQHNFENSYATDTARVDYYRAALEGTSFLVLPKLLGWFTSNIAYHHIHHLSLAIPNYRLAACHNKWEPIFKDVKRIHLNELLETFKYQLWDPKLERIVSRAEVTQSLS